MPLGPEAAVVFPSSQLGYSESWKTSSKKGTYLFIYLLIHSFYNTLYFGGVTSPLSFLILFI